MEYLRGVYMVLWPRVLTTYQYDEYLLFRKKATYVFHTVHTYIRIGTGRQRRYNIDVHKYINEMKLSCPVFITHITVTKNLPEFNFIIDMTHSGKKKKKNPIPRRT